MDKARSFAEEAAVVCDFGKQEVLDMVLAAAEIFIYLCRNAGSGENVEMISTEGAYYLQMDFAFSQAEINLRAFNLTYKPSYEKEQDSHIFTGNSILIARILWIMIE